jgi:hypothetical protein
MGRSRGGGTTKSHRVAAEARTALAFALSPGQAHDASEGRTLLDRVGRRLRPTHLLMDRAYEGDAATGVGFRVGSGRAAHAHSTHAMGVRSSSVYAPQ